MRQFLILLKKEIKELLTIQIILPFLIVVIMFSLLGNYMESKTEEESSKAQGITILNEDTTEISKNAIEALQNSNFSVTEVTNLSADEFTEKIKTDNTPVSLIIPADFGQNVQNQQPAEIQSYALINNLSMFAGSKYAAANSAVPIINNTVASQNIILDTQNSDLEIYQNPVQQDSFVMVKDKTANVGLDQIMNFVTRQTMIIPIILFLVIILASQMVAVAVATEKENKTLETLLSSPVDRRIIVTAKMVAAGLIALLMAAVYLYGYKSYIDGLMGTAATDLSSSISQIAQNLGFVFTTQSYILLGLSLFFSILVGLSIAMILGAFAQDAKAAQGVIAPLMVLIMIPYFLTLLVDISTLSQIGKYLIYAIPFSHAFLAGPNLLLGNTTFVIYGIIYQAIVFVIFVLIAGKIFSSDYIMTMKLNFSKKK